MPGKYQISSADILSYYKVIWWGRRKKAGPNFLGVGPGRAGTSFLHYMLEQSDDVYLPPRKELNFFGINQKYPLGKQTGLGWSWADYERLFLLSSSERYVGEISPVYLEHPGALEGIAEYKDDMKIIVTLREPLERVISQFRHFSNVHKYDDIESYLEAGFSELTNETVKARDWSAPGKNLRQSLYYDDLNRAFRLFGRDNVSVLIYADLAYDPLRWVRKLEAFFGIRLEGVQVDRRVNASRATNVCLSEDIRAHCRSFFQEDVAKTSELIGDKLIQKWQGLALDLCAF